MKNVKKQVIEWIISFIISFFIANFLISFYFYDPGWIKRDTGATRGIYEPGSKIIKADEGYTITNVDSNGYINEYSELCEQGYTLIMGNSQSNGCNVMPSQKWISLLNDEIKTYKNEEKGCVYNISVGGYDYCDIISGMPAAIEEFPYSDTLIIQIITTDLPLTKLQECLSVRAFSEETKGDTLKNNLTAFQKIRNKVKDYFPLITYIYEFKIKKIEFSFDDAFFYKPVDYGTSEENIAVVDNNYAVALDNTMKFLTDTYSGNILILYLPSCSLKSDGLHFTEEATEPIFKEICEKNDIAYLNMTYTFQNMYTQEQAIPYGFSNTKLGYGHLNETGHKIVSDTLFVLWQKMRND